MVVAPLVTLAWASPVKTAPVTVAAVSGRSCRRSEPGFQPAMVPSRVAKRNMAGRGAAGPGR